MVLSKLLHFVLPFGLAMIITFVLTPFWISVCRKWNLFDEPDNRKHHQHLTPSMGGIALFAGLIISFLSFSEIEDYSKMQYLLGGLVILFFTGFFDDLMNIPAAKKMLFQLAAGAIIYFGGFRLDLFPGFESFGKIPDVFSFPLTLFAVIMFTNAYNFIDGADGLACSIGLIISASLGMVFLILGRIDFATISFCLTGALLGFLFFNFQPAKIFMGDTGSLVVGFLLIVLALEAIQSTAITSDVAINPSLIYAILFVPAFDLVRVFVIRVMNGDSPLDADRNHLHHLVMKNGFGHGSTTILICLYTTSVISLQLTLLSHMSVILFLMIVSVFSLLVMNSKVLGLLAQIRDWALSTISSEKI